MMQTNINWNLILVKCLATMGKKKKKQAEYEDTTYKTYQILLWGLR